MIHQKCLNWSAVTFQRGRNCYDKDILGVLEPIVFNKDPSRYLLIADDYF